MLTIEQKLKNFPSVNYTSLSESVDRREFMRQQFAHYGIKSNQYVTERFGIIADSVKFSGNGIDDAMVQSQFGSIVSHVNLLRHWYQTTNEEYAIFCEDDVSFESINYWNFTWQEFIQALPTNWECVQLTRVTSMLDVPPEVNQLLLELRMGYWWGAYYMMKRTYVKKLLENICVGFNEYRLDISHDGLFPIIETLLFRNIHKEIVYSFPLLIESDQFQTTFYGNRISHRVEQEFSHKTILNQWINHGSSMDLHRAMILPSW
jgi:hypothetical protein